MSPRPLQPKLYAQVKRDADTIYAVPSAYKSGWIVKTYKSLGGQYAEGGKQHSLGRWFQEKWVDLNRRRPDGSYPPCGRPSASSGPYPLCRPSRRVSSKTPATVQELPKKSLKRAQHQKAKAPGRHVRFEV